MVMDVGRRASCGVRTGSGSGGGEEASELFGGRRRRFKCCGANGVGYAVLQLASQYPHVAMQVAQFLTSDPPAWPRR